MIKVLYIEDDLMIGKTTCQLLQHENYAVDWVTTGSQALDFLFKHTYHLILLDLGLPEVDGVDVLKHIRKKAELDRSAVIVISARDQIKDKVSILKLGADDYLVKPYDFDELTARMECLLRRTVMVKQDELCFTVGKIKMFPKNHRIMKENEIVNLSTKEWLILEPMMMYPNQIFSRHTLEEKLYDWHEDIQSNTIEVHIHNLRSKLGKHFIRTVRGVGYCIEEQHSWMHFIIAYL